MFARYLINARPLPDPLLIRRGKEIRERGLSPLSELYPLPFKGRGRG
jgi:hypothetical protein